MNEYVTPDGEILQLEKSPYQAACSELAAFKLHTIETVAADPRLHGAPCVQVIVVYLSFLKVDKASLKWNTVYASSITLMTRGCIKSDRTARNARGLLALHGYLIPSGSSTKDGCLKFHVANPRAEAVAMHVREYVDFLRERDADRKKEERRKRGKADVPVYSTTPQNGCPGSNYQDVPVNSTTKYHRGDLRDSCSEGSDDSLGMSVPFAIPDNEAEVEEILSHASTTNPTILTVLRSKLMNGELTPFLLLYGFQEAAQ